MFDKPTITTIKGINKFLDPVPLAAAAKARNLDFKNTTGSFIMIRTTASENLSSDIVGLLLIA